MRTAAVVLLAAVLTLRTTSAVGETLPGGLPTETPTMGSGDLTAGLADCQIDSECVVVDAIGCCPCWMGGAQGAIRSDKQGDLLVRQAASCDSGACLAVYLCRNVGAICQSSTCALVTLTPTITPTAAPAGTPTPVGCVGDCNGDGEVTIDEILVGVNVVLGNLPADACSAFECCQGCNVGIQVACLITAVNSALSGCSIWRLDCGPIIEGVEPCLPSVTSCTADQSPGRACDSQGAICCPGGVLCDPSGQFCDAPLVCDIRPPSHCPVWRTGGPPGA